MQKFRVNDYITLNLEGKETFIYIKGERFIQCKFLLLNIPIKDINSLDEVESIDEISKILDKSQEPNLGFLEDLHISNKIPPEVEFWGHCSNLQVWFEMDYNTKLLHSNIAFPMLRKLTEVGDIKAQRVFKEEIARRIESGYEPTIRFLCEEGYIDFLDVEYIIDIRNRGYFDFLLDPLTKKVGKIVRDDDFNKASSLLSNKYLKYIDSSIIIGLFQNSKINFISQIVDAMNQNPSELGEWGYSFFEFVGDILSPIIKDNINSLLTQGRLRHLLSLWESPAINCFTTKDINDLLKDQSIELLNNLLKALREEHIDSMFFLGKNLFSQEIEVSTKMILREEIFKIIEKEDLGEISQLIGLGLFEILDYQDFLPLLNDINFTLNYIKIFDKSAFYTKELSKYDINTIYYPFKFFKGIMLNSPSIFTKVLIEILNTCDSRDLTTILDFKLFDLIAKDDLYDSFYNLTPNERILLSDKLSNAIKESDDIEDNFWITELLETTVKSLPK
ncbi:MAG: hypothetical protein ACFE8B_12965 [Candidatus Hermodarchaeota archaeon]